MPNENILLYDGECNLCNKFVNFVNKVDTKGVITVIPYQNTEGQKYAHLLILDKYGTVALIRNGKALIKSDAVLSVFEILGGVYSSFTIFKWIPKQWRDYLYTFVAKHRFWIFGKKDSCTI